MKRWDRRGRAVTVKRWDRRGRAVTVKRWDRRGRFDREEVGQKG